MRLRERTLFAAVLLSVWAPVTTGAAVLLCRSTTQIADFVRRTAELAAVFVSWQVFRRVERRQPTADERARLERIAGLTVAAALGCSGVVMLVLAAFRLPEFRPGGNVYPGMAIAFLGLITNGWFWRRYTMLAREQHARVIESQRHLYRAKALVDLCVLAALASVAVSPSHPITRYVDVLGSIAVAGYLLYSGVGGARTALRAPAALAATEPSQTAGETAPDGPAHAPPEMTS